MNPPPLEGADLTDFDRDEDFVRACMNRVGIAAPLGTVFPCVLPEHSGDAVLWLEGRGIYVYRDVHSDSAPNYPGYALAEVYAAIVSGHIRRWKGSALARWKLRLLAELGYAELPDWRLLPVPPNAPASAKLVHAGVELLFRVRALAEPLGEEIPLAREFLAHWCACTPNEAEAGKRALIQNEIVVPAGASLKGGRATYLWRPHPNGSGERTPSLL